VKSGARIPADMITLYSDDEQGTLFLKTDQLDGETDWKLRKAVKKTQSIIKSQRNYSHLINDNLTFTVK
jgi:phospholipid-translocating ATPase